VSCLRSRIVLAGGCVLLLALAASAGALASRHGARASARSSACNLKTATAVMNRYYLIADPSLPRPVANVICGAFAGPGSRGMAASSVHGVCLPFLGWGAFRYVGGSWKLMPGGRHSTGSVGIKKVGNTIVEKEVIRHAGETICLASGLKSRAWHWSGSKLVAGPWKVIKP